MFLGKKLDVINESPDRSVHDIQWGELTPLRDKRLIGKRQKSSNQLKMENVQDEKRRRYHSSPVLVRDTSAENEEYLNEFEEFAKLLHENISQSTAISPHSPRPRNLLNNLIEDRLIIDEEDSFFNDDVLNEIANIEAQVLKTEKQGNDEKEDDMDAVIRDIKRSPPASIPSTSKKPFNEINSNQAPRKATPEEIEMKKQEALRRQQMNKNRIANAVMPSNLSIQRPGTSKICVLPPKPSAMIQPRITSEEIEMKRQEALKRRHMRMQSETISTEEPPAQRRATYEEIEQKRQEALKRLHMNNPQLAQRILKDAPPKTTPEKIEKSSDDLTPEVTPQEQRKASPEEIEMKRQEALRRRQLNGYKVVNPDISQSKKVNQLEIAVISQPRKATPEEIEQKRQEALRRRLERSNLSQQVQNEPPPSQRKATPEEIEMKRQEAMKRRKIFLENQKKMQEQGRK